MCGLKLMQVLITCADPVPAEECVVPAVWGELQKEGDLVQFPEMFGGAGLPTETREALETWGVIWSLSTEN